MTTSWKMEVDALTGGDAPVNVTVLVEATDLDAAIDLAREYVDEGWETGGGGRAIAVTYDRKVVWTAKGIDP